MQKAAKFAAFRSFYTTFFQRVKSPLETGELILKAKEPDRYGTDKEWRDAAEAPLEVKLSNVIAEIPGMFVR